VTDRIYDVACIPVRSSSRSGPTGVATSSTAGVSSTRSAAAALIAASLSVDNASGLCCMRPNGRANRLCLLPTRLTLTRKGF
jgi:hypothetical protein